MLAVCRVLFSPTVEYLYRRVELRRELVPRLSGIVRSLSERPGCRPHSSYVTAIRELSVSCLQDAEKSRVVALLADVLKFATSICDLRLHLPPDVIEEFLVLLRRNNAVIRTTPSLVDSVVKPADAYCLLALPRLRRLVIGSVDLLPIAKNRPLRSFAITDTIGMSTLRKFVSELQGDLTARSLWVLQIRTLMEVKPRVLFATLSALFPELYGLLVTYTDCGNINLLKVCFMSRIMTGSDFLS